MHEPTCAVPMKFDSLCEARIVDDIPVPLCMPHFLQVFGFGIRMAAREMSEPATEFSPEAPDPRQGVVYYVRVGDQVKIGTTVQAVEQRLEALPPSMRILATEPGGRQLEAARHAQFWHLRIAGKREWFRLAPDLRAHVRALSDATCTSRLQG